ncbi:TPA: ead/Ea22-like family protein [Escherichia coli]|nr:ead/Ea22-like family protein [Escherichia coli]
MMTFTREQLATLREASEAAKEKTTWQSLQAFRAAATPEVVLALLDELETAKARIAELSEKRLAGVPTIPDEVLSAIRKVARMRVDSVAFDGDKRGLINALDEAEDALILTVSEYADEIAAAEIKD